MKTTNQNQATPSLTTEKLYWEMLEVLPPAYQAHNCFMVGEPSDHKNGLPTYACFFSIDDDYYECNTMTISEFKAFMTLSDEEKLENEEEPSDEIALELGLRERFSDVAVDAFIYLFSESQLDEFEDKYEGEFNSDEDFAQNYAESCCDVDFSNLPWPQNCIDWEEAAKEHMQSYTSEKGYYFNCY